MDLNNRLLALSEQVYDLEFAMETGKKPFESIRMAWLLKKISEECTQLHKDTKISVGKAIESISRKFLKNECDLAGWWGRGQQYLCFTKLNTVDRMLAKKLILNLTNPIP